MSDSSPENFSYFANIAESYDRIQRVLSPPYARGLEMIVDLIPFDLGEPFEFVDLGCGTAEPTARVLYRFRRATGTCVDSEPEMLRIAKRKLTPYSGRVEVKEADITRCTLPSCDMVFSAKTIHHVHPGDLQSLFARISSALRPNGRFILYDTMSVVPGWGAEVRLQSTHYRERHIRNAIESGMVTREEIDARREYKRKMKAAGKDVEYEHRAEDLIRTMNGTGFNDVAVCGGYSPTRSCWRSCLANTDANARQNTEFVVLTGLALALPSLFGVTLADILEAREQGPDGRNDSLLFCENQYTDGANDVEPVLSRNTSGTAVIRDYSVIMFSSECDGLCFTIVDDRL